MNFGTREWQERVNYFKDLDLRLSCNEQWLRTIQVAPPERFDRNDSTQGGQREDKNPVFHSNLQLS